MRMLWYYIKNLDSPVLYANIDYPEMSFHLLVNPQMFNQFMILVITLWTTLIQFKFHCKMILRNNTIFFFPLKLLNISIFCQIEYYFFCIFSKQNCLDFPNVWPLRRAYGMGHVPHEHLYSYMYLEWQFNWL